MTPSMIASLNVGAMASRLILKLEPLTEKIYFVMTLDIRRHIGSSICALVRDMPLNTQGRAYGIDSEKGCKGYITAYTSWSDESSELLSDAEVSQGVP